MKICLIKALATKFRLDTIKSIKKEFIFSKENFKIYKELSRRENTLNKIIKDNKKNKEDLLIIADDIVLTKGWKKKIDKYKKKYDVFSFQTLYPNSKYIQDYGYDLVRENKNIILKAKNRGKKIKVTKKNNSRECFGLCGCLFYLSNEPKQSDLLFSKDGMNRWSEFIYFLMLKNKGFKIGVINHAVYHNPISTKQKSNKKLSSISYNLEKVYWKKIVQKYNLKKYIAKSSKVLIDNNLKIILNSNKKIVLFGAGVISEIILKYKKKDVYLCSGLKEEIGKSFLNKKIYSFEQLKKRIKIDCIIITALGYEKIIINQNNFNEKEIFFLKIINKNMNTQKIKIKIKKPNEI